MPNKRPPRAPEYVAWRSMRVRCINSNERAYKWYGARGITICERWKSSALFMQDMGPRPSPKHSLGRIDRNGNYEPSNCRWETMKEQQRNRRSNRIIAFNGVEKLLVEWAEQIGITGPTLSWRIKNMPFEKAMTMEKQR